MTLFAFGADARASDLDIFAVGDAMDARGWCLDRQTDPDALHLMISPEHERIVDGVSRRPALKPPSHRGPSKGVEPPATPEPRTRTHGAIHRPGSARPSLQNPGPAGYPWALEEDTAASDLAPLATRPSRRRPAGVCRRCNENRHRRRRPWRGCAPPKRYGRRALTEKSLSLVGAEAPRTPTTARRSRRTCCAGEWEPGQHRVGAGRARSPERTRPANSGCRCHAVALDPGRLGRS